MIDSAHRSNFIVQKELYNNVDADTSELHNDNTVDRQNSDPNMEYTTSICMKMMFKMLGKRWM